MVQLSAANAGESASASEEMNVQAQSLREFVNELQTIVEGSKRNIISRGTGSSNGDTAPFAPVKHSSTATLVAGESRSNCLKTNSKDLSKFTKRDTRANQEITRKPHSDSI